MSDSDFLKEQEILLKIKTNQNLNGAVSYLYDSYYHQLQAAILKMNGSFEDADDIVQETMVNFIQIVQEGRFREESTINTILHAIARNLWLTKVNKMKSERQRIDSLVSETKNEINEYENELTHAEERRLIAEMFNGLGESCQKLLKLFYFDELPMKAILPQMNFDNEQVLRNKKNKCMKALMEKIDLSPEWAATLKNTLKKWR